MNSGNVSENCRRHGIAQTLYYRWKDEAEQGAKAARGRSAAAAETEKDRRIRQLERTLGKFLKFQINELCRSKGQNLRLDRERGTRRVHAAAQQNIVLHFRLVGAVGIEFTDCMKTKEFCGAAWPSKVLKGKEGNS